MTLRAGKSRWLAVCVAAALPVSSAAAERYVIAVSGGKLTVSLRARPLTKVLDQLATRSGVAIVVEGLEERRVTAEFKDLPLDQGLRELLKDVDAFFFYGTSKGAGAALQVVWVYAPGRGKGLQPVPPDSWASTKELEEQMADRDASMRSDAVEGLIERKGNRALDVVLKALKDEDEQVRMRAMYGAFNSGLELPVDTLVSALKDSSRHVRFLALDSAADRPEGRTLAEAALSDPDIHVRTRAREILGPVTPASPQVSPQKTRNEP